MDKVKGRKTNSYTLIHFSSCVEESALYIKNIHNHSYIYNMHTYRQLVRKEINCKSKNILIHIDIHTYTYTDRHTQIVRLWE